MVGLLPLPRWTLAIHCVQILFAIIILGLDAYGIRWFAYNALIFSLVTAILTLGVCIYIIGTTLFLNNLYNAYIVLAMHILMIIFWITDLGLVANLARLWSDPDYGYTYYYYDYYGYDKRGLAKRETTTVEAYKGALIAGALFGAVQFVLWVLSAVFVILYLNRARSGAPPAYTGGGQGAPAENKYDQTQQQPQNTYPAAQPQPGPYAQQPGYVQQQQSYGQYPQDPVNRADTVSPVSQAGYTTVTSPNVSELGSQPQQHNYRNPNVPELGNR